MLQKNFELEVDIMDQTPKHLGRLVKTDFGGNVLNLRLTKNGETFDLTGASSVTFTVRYNGQYLSAINGTIEDAEKGHVKLNMPDQCISYTGLYEMEVQVKDTGMQMTSAIFMYDVRSDLTDGANPSLDPDYPILTQLIDDVEELETNVETAETNRVTAENTRVSNENTRISNESTRESNETTRVNQESSRVSSESDRVTAESARVSAESTRESNESTRQSQETTRENQEDTRETNEITRQANESTRQSNETEREQFEFIGEYDNSQQYLKNNVVLYQNSSFVALQDTLGNNPPTFPTTNNQYWQLASLKGVNGTNLTYQGVYNNSTTYQIYDLVTYNGKLYHAETQTTGDIPTNLNDWELFFSGGAMGEIDGGNAFSVYTAEQVIEGGDAYGN